MDFALLVGTTDKTDNDENPAKSMSRQVSRRSSTRSASNLSLNGSLAGSLIDGDAVAEEEEQDEGIQMEASSKGKVKGSVPLNYFKSGAHWSILILLLISFGFVQFLASSADYWVSLW